jgi:hypothetical protein
MQIASIAIPVFNSQNALLDRPFSPDKNEAGCAQCSAQTLLGGGRAA